MGHDPPAAPELRAGSPGVRSSLWKHYLSIIMSDNLCILQGNPVIGQGIEDSDLGLPDEITEPIAFHSA